MKRVRHRRLATAFLVLAGLAFTISSTAAWAASALRPAPTRPFPGAPDEFTKFSPDELSRGFMALAFGSDLRVGSGLQRVHRFDRPVRVYIDNGSAADRTQSYRNILSEFAGQFPQLNLTITDSRQDANVVVRLIDEKDFAAAIEEAFGAKTAREFVAKTDPQCMTSVQSASRGAIIHADSFVIVDQGDEVFYNCAYHELLHAIGLSNHDQRNPWTALNQDRTVGYLTVYDRALVHILYHPRIKQGMTRGEVSRVLPQVAREIAAGL